jgi:hypothetical protein
MTVYSTNGMHLSSSKYYYSYTQGVKTGSTTEAGYCLATTAFNPNVNYRYLCVTFGAPMYGDDGVQLENGAMRDQKAGDSTAVSPFPRSLGEYRQQQLVHICHYYNVSDHHGVLSSVPEAGICCRSCSNSIDCCVDRGAVSL